MWVLHSSYGLGQVVALSGKEAGRKATVDFQPPAGRKKLSLAEGGLQPVGKVSTHGEVDNNGE